MIKNNYLFRSVKTARKYVFSIFILQIAGIVVFTLIATLLSFLGLRQIEVIALSAAVSIVAIVAIISRAHKDDMRAIRIGMWPMDTKANTLARVDRFKRGTLILIRRVEAQQRSLEKLLVDNVEIRKKIQAVRATQRLKDLSVHYKRILELRAEGKEMRESLNSTAKAWDAIKLRIEESSDFEQELLSTSTKVKSQQLELDRLQQDQDKIQQFQHAVANDQFSGN